MALKIIGARDDNGVVAVIYALCAVLIFSVGALAVDLGSMYQRRAETQSQADLSALSAANQLGSSTDPTTSHSNAVKSVAQYLIANGKLGQLGLPAASSYMQLVPLLTDGDFANGEVTFPSQYEMTVTTPRAKVNFAMAGAFGVSSSSVTSSATVGVGTPGANAVMPFFVVANGCDWGSQSLTDPANGHSQSVVPTLPAPLSNPNVTSNATLTDLTPYQFDVGATGANAVIATINGTHLSSVVKVGFFFQSGTQPAVGSPPTAGPVPTPNVVEQAIVSNTNNNFISNVPVPSSVTGAAGVWWVRTYTGSGNVGWSPLSQSLPIRVGDGPILCGNNGNQGNFGSLKLPRSDPPASWLPLNIANGLQAPLSLSVQTVSSEIPMCTPGDNGVVYTQTSGSNVTRVADTNCVDTDTGLTSTVTTQGMVTGTPSRMTSAATTTSMAGKQCAPNKSTGQRNLLGRSINNDVLSCFMDSAHADTQLQAIASPSYNGPAVLDPAIYSSPRFCYVPVLSVQPSLGGSNHYSITGMRPCFITGEANDSSYNLQKFMDCPLSQGQSATCPNPDNGLTAPNQKVTTLRIFLFNKNALPAQGGNAAPGVILDPTGPLVSFLVN